MEGSQGSLPWVQGGDPSSKQNTQPCSLRSHCRAWHVQNTAAPTAATSQVVFSVGMDLPEPIAPWQSGT